MKGNNVLILNDLSMIEAMQLYFDKTMTSPQKVVSVTQVKDTYNPNEQNFKVQFEDAPDVSKNEKRVSEEAVRD